MRISRACAVVLLLPALARAADEPEFEPKWAATRHFPVIKNPPSIKASDVEGQVTDEELVLGVEIEGHARAYPINMLTGPRREIINDMLGGHAIAATW